MFLAGGGGVGGFGYRLGYRFGVDELSSDVGCLKIMEFILDLLDLNFDLAAIKYII